MVSARNFYEIVSGFFRVGSVAVRADTVISAPHFSLRERDGSSEYTVQGTLEEGRPVVTAFIVRDGDSSRRFETASQAPRRTRVSKADSRGSRSERRRSLVAAAFSSSRSTLPPGPGSASKGVSAPTKPGSPAGSASRKARRRVSSNTRKTPRRPIPSKIRAWVANQGFERVGLLGFWWRHGRLPDVDWSLLAAFAAIAGAGGLSNALFSNYARDKGWGMGAKVGAIPSAIGGRSIDALARRNGLPHHTDDAETLEGVVPPHRARSGRRLDAVQRRRPGAALYALAGILTKHPGLRPQGRGDDRPGDGGAVPGLRPPDLVVRALRRLPHAGPLCRVFGRPTGQALDRHPLGNQPSGQEARGQPGPV